MVETVRIVAGLAAEGEEVELITVLVVAVCADCVKVGLIEHPVGLVLVWGRG